MSWRVWRWWLAGAVAYLIFLAASFPAAYVAGWVQQRVPQVQLHGVNGSIWSGSAHEATVSGASWGQVQWQFDWAGLFTGHPGYRLALHGTGLTLHARVAGGVQNLLLRDIQGHFALQRLEPWFPLPNGAVSGQLQLQLDQVMLVHNRLISASGVVSLTNTELTWPQAVSLGDYQLKLVTHPGSGIEGTLLDTSGPLMLQGNLHLTPDGRYDVTGTLASRLASDTALNNLLRYLPADQSGGHRFSFSGQW